MGKPTRIPVDPKPIPAPPGYNADRSTGGYVEHNSHCNDSENKRS